MMRTQIQLEEEQHRRLRALAHRRGTSMAALIRECLDEILEREAAAPTYEQRVSALLGVAGRYADTAGEDRVAEEHDRFLLEALDGSAADETPRE